jgi:hypothetical protein
MEVILETAFAAAPRFVKYVALIATVRNLSRYDDSYEHVPCPFYEVGFCTRQHRITLFPQTGTAAPRPLLVVWEKESYSFASGPILAKVERMNQ